MEKSYVYILTNRDNDVLYTGVTSNLAQRIMQHREKRYGGFSAKYNLTKVVYSSLIRNFAIEKQRVDFYSSCSDS